MKRFSKILTILMGFGLGILGVEAVVNAAPPAIDPSYEVPNRFDVNTGAVPSFFMNRNQLAVRLTGREYDERMGAVPIEHYEGSLMRFLEDLLNGTIINATSTVNGATQTGLFQNYIDLLLKRVFDANDKTALDYDTQTFAYVDYHNPAFRVPTQPAAATVTDTNGDGEAMYSREVTDLFALCLPIPLIGNDAFCMNLAIVNVSHFNASSAGSGGMVTETGIYGGGIIVNNVGGKMLDFDGYSATDINGSSHIITAAYPNLTFDNELGSSPAVGCNSPEAPAAAVDCDISPYRDDDDGLFLEVQIKNFALDLLFQPPMTNEVTAIAVYGLGVSNYANNITDLEDVSGVYSLNSGTKNAAGDPVPLGVVGDPVPGCLDQYLGVDTYDEACDLSNYLKAYGQLYIPNLKIQASVRIISSYTDILPDTGPGAMTDTINLGVTLQYVQADANFMLQLNPGPYCQMRKADLTNPAGIGQDGLGTNYLHTDNPNNCRLPADSDNVVNISDDATYLVSEQFTSILPYVRAEIQAKMEDFFDPSTNPGFFFGPTRLLDVNDTLGGISFDVPWYPGTDYARLQVALDSAVDSPRTITGVSVYSTKNDSSYYRGDYVDEFWADPNGVLMPFSGGVGLDWVYDLATNSEVASCVQEESAYTGYVDGYDTSLNGGEDADNPSVSRPIPRLKTQWTGDEGAYDGSGEDYSETLLGRKIPNVNGKAPFAGPNGAVTAASGLDSGSYALGLGIHQNMLSKLLYEAVIDGLLCIEIDGRDPDNLLGAIGETVLNTSLFGALVPFLADNFTDMPMALRIVPYVQNPRNLNWATAADKAAGASYASNLQEVKNTYGTLVTQENPVPRIITGGINQYNFLKDRYAGAITTGSALFNNEITAGAVCATVLDCPAAVDSYGLWPDFSIIIPHLIMEFYVWDQNGAGPDIKKRAFALDVGLNIGLNIDIVQDPGITGNAGFLDAVTSDPRFSIPAYSGTDFPIGCGTNTAYPCEIQNVPSRLVLFLGGIADPEINAIMTYDEISIGDGTAGNGQGVTAGTQYESFMNGAVTDIAMFENSISNLLGLLLSSELGIVGEIGFDLAAWLNIPVVLTVPYIGPSYVANVTGGGANIDGPPSLACGAAGDTACPDPSGIGMSTVRDISDGDLNGFGDYLVVAAGVDLSQLSSDYLFRLLESVFLENIFYDCDTIACNSNYYANSLAGLIGGIGGAPQDYFSDGGLPKGYIAPETYIKGVEKAQLEETIIAFEGTYPAGDASQLTYSWRVDGGLWTPFLAWTRVRIPGLFEGKHVFEVKAKDAKGNVEYSPARVEFVVDSVAPKVTVQGDRIQGSSVAFQAAVRDAQTDVDNVRVSYRVNGGEWSRFSYDKLLTANLAEGRHSIEVRAIDEAGNVSVPEALNFNVQDSGFGCSVASTGGSSFAGMLDFIVLMLLPLGFVIRRKK